jgi:hypothetical protein
MISDTKLEFNILNIYTTIVSERPTASEPPPEITRFDLKYFSPEIVSPFLPDWKGEKDLEGRWSFEHDKPKEINKTYMFEVRKETGYVEVVIQDYGVRKATIRNVRSFSVGKEKIGNLEFTFIEFQSEREFLKITNSGNVKVVGQDVIFNNVAFSTQPSFTSQA